MTSLHRFWFVFEPMVPATPLNLGCGITAFSRDDAIAILGAVVFPGRGVPYIAQVIEDVDLSTFEAEKALRNHVLPNMSPPDRRGVWFPMGFEVDRR